jgi:hypothetical protein
MELVNRLEREFAPLPVRALVMHWIGSGRAWRRFKEKGRGHG